MRCRFADHPLASKCKGKADALVSHLRQQVGLANRCGKRRGAHEALRLDLLIGEPAEVTARTRTPPEGRLSSTAFTLEYLKLDIKSFMLSRIRFIG